MRNALMIVAAAGAAAVAITAGDAAAQTPPTQDLVVWLRADAGVEADGSGNVTAWRDQALAGTGAGAQDALTNMGTPTLVASAAGGDPAIRFNGDNGADVFNMNNAAGGTGANLSSLFPTAARMFIVATPNDNQYSLYSTRQNDSYFRFSDTNGYLGVFRTSRIEQYPSGAEGGGNPTAGDHVWEIVSNASTYQAFIDMVGRTPQAAQFNGGEDHRIGTGNLANVGPYTGDISEILIYNNDSVDRQAVYSYLNQKYGVVPEPGALALVGGVGLLALRGRRRRRA